MGFFAKIFGNIFHHLAKETDCYRRRFLESFFIYFNNYAFIDKTNCFYPTVYHISKLNP